MLESVLKIAKYNEDETNFLCHGFKYGFDLGYEGPTNLRQFSPNLKLRVGSRIELWNKVMKEVKLQRYAGPYAEEPPFENFIQSPIGLVPKDGGKSTRLIFHLSYPRDAKRRFSINANTPASKCTVKYPDFNEAIQMCIAEGFNCHLCKSDMTSAFRNLGMSPDSWKFLVMYAISPIDGRMYFFIDKCMPFSAAISCSHFQRFSNAVAHLVTHKTGKKLLNYLDDYLFAALHKLICNGQLQTFLNVCAAINFPVSIDKTFWGTTSITFLGFLIDTVKQLVMVPTDKIDKARTMIEAIMTSRRRKATVLQIQKLTGFLNFLCRCIIPGRAFTRRMYGLIANPNLKQHHHVRVPVEIIKDLEMWKTFLSHPSIYARPFLDYLNTVSADQLEWFTDASGTIGFDGVNNTNWFYGYWDQEFLRTHKPSIEFQELYAVTVSVLLWLHKYKNTRIILFCDNQNVVAMINNMTSSCKRCLHLIRLIVLHSLKLNVHVFARYINTHDNTRADLLSCGKVQVFMAQFNHKLTPCSIPDCLWPVSKVWLH